MRTNTTRERLAKGEVVYGCGLQVYRAPEIPRAFAAAGFDYVFIDMEHGSFNLETHQAIKRGGHFGRDLVGLDWDGRQRLLGKSAGDVAKDGNGHRRRGGH